MMLAQPTSAPQQSLLKAIDDVLVRSCVNAFGGALRALILTGSVARGEHSITCSRDRWTMLGDVEAIVVLPDHVALPSAPTVSSLCRQLEAQLAACALDTQVSLGIVHVNFLRTLPEHIFSYELRECGRVLWGDAGILREIPGFAAAELSHEDAWRMLCNRIIELLGNVAKLTSDRPEWSAVLQYNTAKLYLDMATSLLVFVRRYVPTYTGRAMNLEAFSQQEASELPFSVPVFSERVNLCTRYKLCPEGREVPASFMQEAISYACGLWRWELQQILVHKGSDGAELVRSLARTQTFSQRLRGWMYVVRHQGWRRSCCHWFRWSRIGVSYTPRYAIYLAGYNLLSALNELAGGPWENLAIKVNRLLPIPLPDIQSSDWPQLASVVFENYKSFVTETRA